MGCKVIRNILGKDVSKNRKDNNNLVWSPKSKRLVRYERPNYKKDEDLEGKDLELKYPRGVYKRRIKNG